MRDEQPLELRRVVIKEELVRLTGHWRMALILNQFLYWLQRHRHYDQFLAEEQARNPELQVPTTHGWIYKSTRELQHELMVDVSEVTLRRDIKALVDRGWLAERHNPNHRWDRELQYRPDIRRIQRDLQAIGYALEGYPLLADEPSFMVKDASIITKNASFTMKDRSFTDRTSMLHGEESILHHEGAIPEIKPETTVKTSHKDDEDVVVALERLGLTHGQAMSAVEKHDLSLGDVDAWARWKHMLPPDRRPDTLFAGLIRKQRLPPGGAPPPSAPVAAPSPSDTRKEQGRAVPVATPEGTRTLPATGVWQTVLDDLKGHIGRNDFDTWLRPTALLDVEDGVAVVGVPNVFVRQEVESRYAGILGDALQRVLGYATRVELVMGGYDTG